MSRDSTTVRCPVCKGFGSNRLGGYCKNHAEQEGEKHAFDDYCKPFAQDRPFFSNVFGAIKDKFGLER